MLFSSISFIYMFLPLVLLIYFVAPIKLKNLVLLLASLFFYFVGEPVYTLLLIFSAVSNYLYGIYIDKHRGQLSSRIVIILSVIINLGILAFFKYADFFVDNISLPIGISFFTFQTMSYTIDVYRNNVATEKNIIDFSMYVSLFPQLIAGPIVRLSDIQGQIKTRKISLEMFSSGITRFILGLGKKVLIANALGEIVLSYTSSDEKSVLFVWLYALSYSLQIYFDFSGYSDMAIGLGKMFGFTFPENFNYPFISKSITEFWRRWHITLGSWFRDYVYIPLGGNRVSKLSWARNVFIVWLLTGLWHGAYWNFALWGLLYGFLLMNEKLWLGKILEKLPSVIKHIYVLFFVIVSFVIFNGASMTTVLFDLKAMFGLGGLPLSSVYGLYYLKSYILLIGIAIIGATPLPKKIAPKLTILQPVVVGLCLICVTAFLVDGSFNPFLYFRF